MTTDEVKFAMIQRHPVLLVRGSIEIFKPMEIHALSMVRRSRHEEERGKGQFYTAVVLLDPNGRGTIDAKPEQLDPAYPEEFAAKLAWYNEGVKKRGKKNGAGE